MKHSRFGGLLFLLIVVTGSLAIVFFRQDVTDWWRLRAYHVPSAIQQITAQDQLTDYGRKVFYVAHPAIEDRSTFNQHCNSRSEKTIVLGCYDGRKIYVYNVTNQQLKGVIQVTAAHEMLHAAYERLSSSEKKRINGELEQQLSTLHDAHIDQLVQEYKKTEPGQLDNELHSILATEVIALNPQLEQYYTKYFRNRSAIATLANQYEGVFTDSENQIVTIDNQLSQWHTTITQNEATLHTEQDQLNLQQAQMDQLRQSQDVATYNARVSDFNSQVNRYNNLLASTKDLIAEYNQLVGKRNNLATAHNNLTQSLNSNLAPLPAQ